MPIKPSGYYARLCVCACQHHLCIHMAEPTLVIGYEGSQTGGWYLTVSGIREVRAEIRQAQKSRHEQRAHLVVWISAITGVIGAITGLVAVLQTVP